MVGWNPQGPLQATQAADGRNQGAIRWRPFPVCGVVAMLAFEGVWQAHAMPKL